VKEEPGGPHSRYDTFWGAKRGVKTSVGKGIGNDLVEGHRGGEKKEIDLEQKRPVPAYLSFGPQKSRRIEEAVRGA